MRIRKNSDAKFLKLFVYFMGLALVASILVITYSIYIKSSEAVKTFSNTKICKLKNVIIDNHVQSVSMDGENIAILTTLKDNKQKLIIMDYCTHEVINEIVLDIKNLKDQNVYGQDIEEPTPNMLS